MPLPSKLKVAGLATVLVIILVLLGLLVFWMTDYRPKEFLSETESMNYLIKYGYVDDDVNSTNEDAIKAMKVFQKEAGVEITGILNEDTMRLMKLPRCGRAFSNKLESEQPRWQKKNLTYSIKSYPETTLTAQEVDLEISRAFQVWSDHTDLTFRVLGQNYRVDIEISFEVADHGDGERNKFDGPAGTLAHAYFPQDGRTHFDDTETWTINSYVGINLFQVAAHEFGHALGLAHSEVEGALMAPFYTGYQEHFELHADDIERIQALYGKKNICQNRVFDTIFTDLSGTTYVIKGSQYWVWESNGAPRDVSTKWTGLPKKVDAAFSHREIGKTYFFSGAYVWRYQGDRLDPGYPKRIEERFPGIPNNVDAAFVWPFNKQIYFIKESKLWMFDYKKFPPVSSEFPQNISASWWRGVPATPDAVFTRGFHTFFAKDGRYARFNDYKNDPIFIGTPKDIGDMIGCRPAENLESQTTAFDAEKWQLSAQELLHEKLKDEPNAGQCASEEDCIMP